MKKISKILSFILVICCSIFAFAGCGSNPYEGDPDAISGAINNFNGFKAVYIPKRDRENVTQEATIAFELLNNTSIDALTEIEAELELETGFATDNQTKLTAFFINEVLGLQGSAQLSTTNNEISQETMIEALKDFSYYGLKEENIENAVAFICSLSPALSSSNITVSMILETSVVDIISASLGEGQTYCYNLYIQNYSVEYIVEMVQASTIEEPFLLPEQNYVAIIYMNKGEIEVDSGEKTTKTNLYYGFWDVVSTDEAILSGISASLEFMAKDATQANKVSLEIQSDDDLGNFFMLDEEGMQVEPRVQFTTINDETSGGEVTKLSEGEPKRVYNGTNFDVNGIIKCMKQTPNGWRYISATHDVLQLAIQNETNIPFALGGIGSLIFEKI